ATEAAVGEREVVERGRRIAQLERRFELTRGRGEARVLEQTHAFFEVLARGFVILRVRARRRDRKRQHDREPDSRQPHRYTLIGASPELGLGGGLAGGRAW